MSPFALVTTVENWLYTALAVVTFALAAWAFLDCLTRHQNLFDRAGLKGKSFWLLLNGVALLVGLIAASSALFGVGSAMAMLQVAALCVASVYLAGPRRELKLYGGSGA